MKKILSITLAVGMLAFTVSPVLGVTIEELQAQIAALMAQLQQLQGSQGGQAYNFTRDLTVGMKGDDVTALQNYLISTGHFTHSGGATGYFGPITKAAVAAWQAANGVSPASGYFGPISRAKYNALTSATTPTPAPTETVTPTPTSTPTPTPAEEPTEGSLEVKLSATPANNTEIELGGTAKAVLGIELKAKDSNMTVKRIDVQTGAQRPWLNFAHIGLYDGDNAIVGITPTSANSYEFDSTTYGIRFATDFTIPKGTTKVITVKVSALSAITGQTSDLTRTITVPTTGIRAVDTAGISGNYGATGTSRNLIIKYTASGTMEVALNSNSPEERIVQTSDSAVTENIEALRLDLKAKTTNATLKRLTVSVNGALVSGAKLFDGDTLLASETISGGYATFTDLTVALTKDVAKTLTVKIDSIATTTSGTTTVAYANMLAEDVHYNIISSITGTATGKIVHLYNKAPQLALVSSSLSVVPDTQNRRAQGNIKIKVTAVGGDIFIATTSVPATGGIIASSTLALASTSYNVAPVSGYSYTTGSWGWKVAGGQEGIFDVAVALNNHGGTAGFHQAWISKLVWNTTDSATGAISWTDMLGLGKHNAVGDATLKTPAVYLAN